MQVEENAIGLKPLVRRKLKNDNPNVDFEKFYNRVYYILNREKWYGYTHSENYVFNKRNYNKKHYREQKKNNPNFLEEQRKKVENARRKKGIEIKEHQICFLCKKPIILKTFIYENIEQNVKYIFHKKCKKQFIIDRHLSEKN